MVSYPHTLAPKNIYTGCSCETNPLADVSYHGPRTIAFFESPLQESPRLVISVGAVIRHEQLGGRIYCRERGALGVPGRVDSLVAGEVKDLVAQKRELV